MALFASVVPRGAGELPCMFVLMAINAERKLDLETGVFPRGNMARGTLHPSVGKDQWEAGLCMVRDGKR